MNNKKIEKATNDFFTALMILEEDAAFAALSQGAQPFAKRLLPVTSLNYSSVINPIMRALGVGMERLALELCQRASVEDLRWGDAYGWTPLTSAAHAGNLEVLKMLSRVDDPAQCRQQGGVTALMCAAESGSLPCFDFLLPLSVLDARDCHGLSALEFAAKGHSLMIIDKLIALGLPMESGVGPTALMIAAEHGDVSVVQHLLASYDPQAIHPKNGWTALDIAWQSVDYAPEIVDAIAVKSGEKIIKQTLLDSRNVKVELPECRLAYAQFEGVEIGASIASGVRVKKIKTL